MFLMVRKALISLAAKIDKMKFCSPNITAGRAKPGHTGRGVCDACPTDKRLANRTRTEIPQPSTKIRLPNRKHGQKPEKAVHRGGRQRATKPQEGAPTR